MLKACAFDLDGTLVARDKKELSEAFKKTIQELRKRGIISILITSRSHDEMKKFEKGIYDYFDMSVLSTGGSFYKDGKLIKSHKIKYSDIKETIQFFKEEDVLCAYAHDDGVFYFNRDDEEEVKKKASRFFTNGFQVKEFVENTDFLEFYYNLDFRERAIVIPENKKINAIKFHYHGVIKPKGINKGTGLLEAIHSFNINIEDVIVFGDHVNDIDMFKVAKHAIAMDNAIDELKEYATDICENVVDDGVAVYLEKLIKEGLI